MGRFDFSGGALCLDYANTLGDRPRCEKESLREYADVVEWCREAGLIPSRDAARLVAEAGAHPRRAAADLAAAIALRESLYALFAALARGQEPPPGDLDLLNRALPEVLGHLALERRESGFTWRFTAPTGERERLLWPVVRSAAELLASGGVAEVRECASETCSWLFLDRSRTHRRRWCDMKSCGNRAKARRHYARLKGQEPE